MRKYNCILYSTAVLMAILPQYARAATIQSNGTGGGEWQTGSSWQGGVVPLATDDVVIVAGDSILNRGDYDITCEATLTIQSAGTFELTMLGPDVLSAPTIVFDGGSFTNNGSFYADTAAFEFRNGSVAVNNGSISTSSLGSGNILSGSNFTNNSILNSTRFYNWDVTGGSTFTNAAGGTITFDDTDVSGLGCSGAGTTFENQAGAFVNIRGGHRFSVCCGATVTNRGSFALQSGGDLDISAGGTVVNDQGFVSIEATSAVTNAGTFTTLAGTVFIDGSFVNDGTVSQPAAGAIENAMYNNGVFRNNSGAVFDTSGYFTSSGTLENDGTIATHDNPGGVDNVFNIYGYTVNRGSITLVETDGYPADRNMFINEGVFINQGNISVEQDAELWNSIDGSMINRGTIDNIGMIRLSYDASFTNETSGIITNQVTGSFRIHNSTGHQNEGVFNNLGEFALETWAPLPAGFSNTSGTFVNETSGTVEVLFTSTFSNGFCGRLTNNATVTNNGVLSNCGLIDGVTGLAGIIGSGILDTTSCGGGAPDATLMVNVTDSTSFAPVPTAEVYLERVCLPMGTQLPFLDVDSGAARFFLGAIEPSQYEIKVFAPGFAPVSGRVVVIQSGDEHIEDIALTPDPTAVNTMKIDIAVDTGGNLVTDNFQVTQDGGTPFQPTVTIDGLSMKLVGLKAGDTTAQALIEDYDVDSVNTVFVAVQPRVFEAVTAAVSVELSGTATGKLVFAVAPPNASGVQVKFKRKTEGTSPPLSGQDFEGAAHVFDATQLAPVGGHPDWYSYTVEVNAGEYYVAASNLQGTLMSQVLMVTIEPSVMGSYSVVPDLNITLPSDDADGDGLPDNWENLKELDALSAALPHGAGHDKEPDGLTNAEEFILDIHPNRMDTDGDTYPDGFERYDGFIDALGQYIASDPRMFDSPPLWPNVHVRYGYTGIIKVGSPIMPMASVQTGIGRLANGGTLYIQNAGAAPLAEPGAFTLGAGSRPMVLRLADPAGPPVRLGSSN